jgi:hypothetical protein
VDRVVSAPFFAASLLVGMLVFLEVGRRLGAPKLARSPDGTAAGTGPIEGTTFALFGLLLAFTFHGAGSRFDYRREIIAEEANTIGTAYLRLDLLPADTQPSLRDAFREYLDARIEGYRRIPEVADTPAEFARAVEIQNLIWTQAVPATLLPGAHPDAGRLLLPALNEMIDITTTRTMAAGIHPPPIIFALLFGLGLCCSLLAGHGMAGKERRWLHILGFVVTTVITVFVVLDVEAPRRGLFRVDAFDQVLVELRQSMK